MKSYLFCTLLLAGLLVNAQTYFFSPKWKVGDHKKINIEEKRVKHENGKLVEDTIEFEQAEIKILRTTDQAYILELKYENEALKLVRELYESLGENETNKYVGITLKISVDIESGEPALYQWEKSQKHLLDGIKTMESFVNEKDADLAIFAKKSFMQLRLAVRDQESAANYFAEFYDFLLIPFETNYKAGQRISLKAATANPFNPKETMAATIHYELLSKEKKLFELKKETEMDFSPVLESMMQMLGSMMHGFGLDSTEVVENISTMEGWKMEMTDEIIFNYNEKSGWVTKSIHTGTYNMYDPRKKNHTKGSGIITRTVSDL